MQTHPLIYVCIMSAFNLPEFESCLLRKPSHLVLIASDYHQAQEGAELFEQLIDQWSEHKVTVIRPDRTASFNGMDFVEYQNWLQNTLDPILKRLDPNLPRACNITGGTKLMALGLMHSRTWDWIDYKAERAHQLQEYQFKAQSNSIHLNQELDLPLASAKQVAKLYSRQVNTAPINRIAQGKAHIDEALRLWEGLRFEDPNLMAFFGNENYGLESIWMYGRGNKAFNQATLEFTAKEFIGTEHFTPEQEKWLRGWARLETKSLSYHQEKPTLMLPGNRGSNAFKRWLSGDWLELLVSHWLEKEAGIPQEQIAVNLKVNPNEQEEGSKKQANYGERETDILVHTEKGTTVIEIKTDLPPNEKSMQAAIRQITSLGDRMGRSRKALFIGPQLYRKIEDNLDEILLSCKAARVELLYSKEALLNYFSNG